MTKLGDKAADDIPALTINAGGRKRRFDIDDPTLPDWIAKKAMRSGGYPYDKKLKRKTYEASLKTLQIELVKLQAWLQAEGGRVMVLFGGRDAAAGLLRWDDYTEKRDLMLERTHAGHAPWTVVLANDKRRARLAVIRRILLSLPYDGRDLEAIGKEDATIIGTGPDFLSDG